MAALSVEYLRLGINKLRLFFSDKSFILSLKPLLAETPPTIEIFFMLFTFAALINFPVRTSITAVWKLAQTLLIKTLSLKSKSGYFF